jgi:hypothetical protein
MKKEKTSLIIFLILFIPFMTFCQTREERKYILNKYQEIDSTEFDMLKNSSWKQAYTVKKIRFARKIIPPGMELTIVFNSNVAKFIIPKISYSCKCDFVDYREIQFNCSEKEQFTYLIIKLSKDILVADVYQKKQNKNDFFKLERIVFHKILPPK